ncbi:hypothetical protein ACQKM2_24670 [Streptomyces sp. NPDC004126]|uniref:D-alanyl-D-alanine carboxypeptidase family protein n=1 Tax=Streptomyces sp. NPDC004126 TaxID=3390695 RepID=UPI003D0909A0
MAGESPDKSVDEGASGEQDPRLSVFQPRDPLKEAVAAWVAADEADEAGGRTQDADAEPSSASEPASAPSRPSPGRVDPKTPVAGVVRQSPSRDEAPEAEKPSEAAESPAAKPSADARTTAFGVVTRDPAPESEKSGSASAKPAAKPSGDVRTTAFGVVKSEPAPESEKSGSASAKPGGDAGKPAAKPSGDVRTTAFGVVTADPAREAEKPARDPRTAAADSERTAVFRAVKPGSASADADKPAADAEKPPAKPSGDVRTTAFGVVKKDSAPEADKPAADPRTAAADSERTAVFRTVKPGSGSGSGPEKPSADAEKAEKAAESDSERTTVFRAIKPGSGSAAAEKPDAKKPATPPAESDSERTAVFRAVKPGSASPDAEKEKPAGKPAADARTTAFGVVKQDAEKPGKPSQDPRAAKPGAAKADAPKPDTDRPGTAGPGTDRPGTAKPGTGTGTAKPGAAGPGKPATAGPATDRPGPAKPGTGPGTAKPSAAGPGAGESDRRVSTFVPLRGEGESGPGAKPPVRPTPPPPPPRPSLDPSERTTQQPLPPRPPLDMLADLTNNPPPPPTPMRNAVRRVKIYAPLVLLLIIVMSVVQLVRPLPAPKLKLTAKATYTFPGGAPNLPWPTEGQASMAAAGLGTIGSSGEQKPVPIASVTKSMTAYIIMRDHPFKKGEKGAMIDVDKTAETEGQKDKSDNESTLNTVKEGEKISEYDAIAALMIPSANNIARLLARWDSGSQEAFVKKMNDTAKELGMTNTTYTDPSGLDATTVSTAEDQVKLGLKIVEIPALVDITRMPAWTDQTGKVWQNWNRLVPFNDSLGIKTGTTTKAGGNLLFAAQKKVGDTNQLLVGAVLGQHKPPIIDTVIAQSRSLLIATQKEVQGAPVVKKGQVVGYVDDGLGGHTPVVATADVQAVGWSSLTVDIKLGDGGTAIPESAKAGTQVGVLTVGDGASQVKVPVALQRALDTPGFGSKLTRIG